MHLYLPLAPVTLTHLFLSFFSRKPKLRLINPREKVAVLVTVFNEGKGIINTLNAAMRQTSPPDIIIVSEHASTDNSRECIEQCLGYNKYKAVFQPTTRFFKSAILYENTVRPKLLLLNARKRMSKAEGINAVIDEGFLKDMDWVVTIDSDTVLKSDFLHHFRQNMYGLKVTRKRMIITQNTVLGAVVMPKENKKAATIEKLIARAREAEYSFGQILIRTGQNATALYVAPGCGFGCRTEVFRFPNRTVTEDLELTQGIQSKSDKFSVKGHRMVRFSDELTDFVVVDDSARHMHLSKFIDLFRKKRGEEIVFKYNRARFVKEAMMFTQEPHNMKSLAIQIDRWTRGFHQVMSLRWREFRKKGRLAWTVYGAKYEGLASSLVYIGIPLLAAAYLLSGFGLKPKFLLSFLAADLVIQYLLVSMSIYKKLLIEGKTKILFKALKSSALDLLPWYALRAINSVQFLKTFLGTLVDTRIKNIHDWSAKAIWQRPKEV